MPKEKKSFKKFATKHLAQKIENRRQTAVARKEQKLRIERKEKREAKEVVQEETQHQEDLARLKETDPEFLQYLENEESNLLDFGRMAQDADVVDEAAGSDAETDADEDDGGQEEEGGGADVADAERPKLSRVTAQEASEVIKSKNFAEAFLLFCSASKELGYPIAEAPNHEKARRRFDSPNVVKGILVSVARLFAAHVGVFLADSGTAAAATGSSEKQKPQRAATTMELKPQYKNLVRRMVGAIFSVMRGATHDGPLLSQLAQSLTSIVRLLCAIRGSTKMALKSLLPLCGHAEESVRVASYLVISSLAKRLAGTRSLHQSSLFKGIFLTLVKTAGQYNIHTLPVVGFLMSCVVDIYGTDVECAYQHTFVYLRQLAIYLRQALQSQTQSNVRAVFNWQYLNALRTWGLVVSTYHEPKQLGPLIHPVVQIAQGMMDLFSSPRMFPMHLHVIEMLNHLSERSGVYVPVSSYVLRILTSSFIKLDAEATRRGATASGASLADELDLQFSLRVKKRHAKLMTFRVGVWREAMFQLVAHLSSLSHSIAFPEATWAVRATLAKLKRDVKVPKVNGLISSALHKLDETVKVITVKRNTVNFGPCDVAAVTVFEDELKATDAAGAKAMPLVQLHQTLRKQRVAEFAAKQQTASAGRQTLEAAVEKGSKQRGGASDRKKGAKRGRVEAGDGNGDDDHGDADE